MKQTTIYILIALSAALVAVATVQAIQINDMVGMMSTGAPVAAQAASGMVGGC